MCCQNLISNYLFSFFTWNCYESVYMYCLLPFEHRQMFKIFQIEILFYMLLYFSKDVVCLPTILVFIVIYYRKPLIFQCFYDTTNVILFITLNFTYFLKFCHFSSFLYADEFLISWVFYLFLTVTLKIDCNKQIINQIPVAILHLNVHPKHIAISLIIPHVTIQLSP